MDKETSSLINGYMEKAKGKPGWTLIEAVVTIVVIAIVVIVINVAIQNSVNVTTVDTAAQKISGDVNYARSQSVNTGQPHGYQINFYGISDETAKNQLPDT